MTNKKPTEIGTDLPAEGKGGSDGQGKSRQFSVVTQAGGGSGQGSAARDGERDAGETVAVDTRHHVNHLAARHDRRQKIPRVFSEEEEDEAARRLLQHLEQGVCRLHRQLLRTWQEADLLTSLRGGKLCLVNHLPHLCDPNLFLPFRCGKLYQVGMCATEDKMFFLW